MHPSQFELLHHFINTLVPADNGVRVVDIGSYDVNGSMRSVVEGRGNLYTGVDITSGPNVDVVIDSSTWDPLVDGSIDFAISGSCLEHVFAPWEWVALLYKKMRTGGVVIVHLPFIMREHRYPVDCYRILPDGLRHLFISHAGFKELACGITANNEDTYFVGTK